MARKKFPLRFLILGAAFIAFLWLGSILTDRIKQNQNELEQEQLWVQIDALLAESNAEARGLNPHLAVWQLELNELRNYYPQNNQGLFEVIAQEDWLLGFDAINQTLETTYYTNAEIMAQLDTFLPSAVKKDIYENYLKVIRMVDPELTVPEE